MRRNLIAVGATLILPSILAACGGGGQKIASAPPPAVVTPAPTPTPTPQDVTFMAKPGTGNFAQFATGKLQKISYDPDTKIYKIQIEDGNFYTLATREDSPAYYRIDPPGSPEWGVSIVNDGAYEGLNYTAIASYSTPDFHRHQLVFGIPTLPEAMPKTGTGDFKGIIRGEGTMPAYSGWGDSPYSPIAGTISFQVKFSDGSLTGLLRPYVSCDCTGPAFNDYSFTALLTGSGFNGAFDMGADPRNFINGVFTGPAAEESMGLWSFPYSVDGASNWVSGAFVAKRGQ